MNLHEYQGKELLNSFGVNIQKGVVATTPEEAVEAAEKLAVDTPCCVYLPSGFPPK